LVYATQIRCHRLLLLSRSGGMRWWHRRKVKSAQRGEEEEKLLIIVLTGARTLVPATKFSIVLQFGRTAADTPIELRDMKCRACRDSQDWCRQNVAGTQKRQRVTSRIHGYIKRDHRVNTIRLHDSGCVASRWICSLVLTISFSKPSSPRCSPSED